MTAALKSCIIVAANKGPEFLERLIYESYYKMQLSDEPRDQRRWKGITEAALSTGQATMLVQNKRGLWSITKDSEDSLKTKLSKYEYQSLEDELKMYIDRQLDILEERYIDEYDGERTGLKMLLAALGNKAARIKQRISTKT